MGRKQAIENRINRALAEGVGGLEFQAQSPPGVGRLIRIPFYLTVAVAGYDAMLGQLAAAIPAVAGTASLTHPGILVSPATGLVGPGAFAPATLLTPQIAWAVLRIVGFESNMRYPKAPVVATFPLDLGFSTLRIQGGADLFVAETFLPASVFLMGQESFAGLRDYPVLEAPNICQVVAEAVGGLLSSQLWFSANLVCEILTDDNYGAHIPGPYARPGALVRQGGSFVR